MKRLIMKFGFLMLLSVSIFAMPIMASDGNGNSGDGCMSKCNKSVAVCHHYCTGDSDLTNTICFILCEAQGVFCIITCPITG